MKKCGKTCRVPPLFTRRMLTNLFISNGEAEQFHVRNHWCTIASSNTNMAAFFNTIKNNYRDFHLCIIQRINKYIIKGFGVLQKTRDNKCRNGNEIKARRNKIRKSSAYTSLTSLIMQNTQWLIVKLFTAIRMLETAETIDICRYVCVYVYTYYAYFHGCPCSRRCYPRTVDLHVRTRMCGSRTWTVGRASWLTGVDRPFPRDGNWSSKTSGPVGHQPTVSPPLCWMPCCTWNTEFSESRMANRRDSAGRPRCMVEDRRRFHLRCQWWWMAAWAARSADF